MNEDFSRRVLRMVVGKVCQPLGMHGMHTSVCETMVDLLKTYILILAQKNSFHTQRGIISIEGKPSKLRSRRSSGVCGHWLDTFRVLLRVYGWFVHS